VRAAKERLVAACQARQLASDDEQAKLANREAYRSLGEVCRAYLDQFADADGLPRLEPPKEIFPPDAAEMFLRMVEGWLVGQASQSLMDLLNKPGAPGRTLPERKGIEAACRYMQATQGDNPLINDPSPVKRIGEWFGVDRATAQSWNRAENRDLVTGYVPSISKRERAALIERQAIEAGRRHARYGRGLNAIARRSRKRGVK
jgi:hypothetical protein